MPILVGAVLSLVLIFVVHLATPGALPYPGPILSLGVVVFAFRGGMPVGLVNAVLSALFMAWNYSIPGRPFNYTPELATHVIVWGISLPSAAVLVGMLTTRANRAAVGLEAESNLQTRLVATKRHEEVLASKETLLRESERRYLFLADLMPQIVWTSRPDGNIDYFNQRWYDYSGISADVTHDQGLIAVTHPEDLARSAELWADSLETGKPYEIEARIRRASDSQFRWHLTRALPLKNESGEIVQWFGTSTDVHGQKTANEQLEETIRARTAELSKANADLARQISERESIEQANQRILAYSPDVICSMDEHGTFTQLSRASTKVWGYMPEELLGLDYVRLIVPEDRQRARLAAAQLRSGDSLADLETQCVRKDGSIVPIMWSMKWSQSNRTLFCVARDISDRKRAESEMLTARIAAESASRSKSEFLANMSHEIRTPMNGILGMVDLALATKLTPQQSHYLDLVQKSAESLVVVINDILDFSKIEAGRLDLEAVPFRVRALIAETIGIFAAQASKKKLDLSYSLADDVPDALVGDPTRLRQVLTNLVGNALKFTERGSVTVRVQLQATDGEHARLHFYVTDTGVGIPPELQTTIFNAFAQADSSTTRKFGGTGLGLTICRALVSRMEGRIGVESTIGKGSNFHFTCFFQVASAHQIPSPQVAPLHQGLKLHVLLAEDNVVNQEVASSILRNAGHQVTIANDGQEALELLERHRPDLVFMDIQMPKIDGIRATQLLRSREEMTGGPRLTIIGLTAHAMNTDRERCIAAGMDDYCTKPFTRQQLLDTVARWSRSTSDHEETEDEAGSHSAEPRTQIFSPSYLLEEMGGDEIACGRILQTFLDSIPELSNAVRSAFQQEDRPAMGRALHTLKGAVGAIGAMPTHAIITGMEPLCAGATFDDLEIALREMDIELQELARSISDSIADQSCVAA